MLGLTLRPDGSAVDAAIEALVEELNKLATTRSGDRDLVHKRHGEKRKPEKYPRAARAEHKRDERTEAAANQLVARIAAVGRAAGFDVAESDEG